MSPPFAYWQQQDRSPVAAFTQHWQRLFPGFRTYGDSEVVPLLQSHFPGAVELYQAVAIPAARADIARLLLLYAHGGMYVGSHLGVDDVRPLESALHLLDEYEGVMVERSPRPPQLRGDQRVFVNMLMIARAGSPWLLDVCTRALANLEAQRRAEQAGSPAPYDIWLLTGPGALTATLSNPDWTALLPGYTGQLAVQSESKLRLRRNQFVPLTGSEHWSVRQLSERLFTRQPATRPGGDEGSVRV